MNLKLKMCAALTVLIGLALPGMAAAHVTVSPEESPAEGYAMLNFVVPHGCDAAPTTSVVVKMPPQVISATPGVVAGWEIEAKEGKLPQPAEQHGEKITEGVRQVTWTGGPLPDGQLEQFPLSVAFAGEAGEAAEFKVIQECAGGAETAWIQSTVAGEEEPEHPAPTVTLTAAEDEHGATADSEDAPAGSETASASESDDDSGDGLAIAALIVGALGLIAGGAALFTARRSR
ncbi:MAG TPA: YcnI family protein [Solirubrobacterales bacterium]|nr:YcnI family protein [Solirubrobacterales bacterium]